MSEVSPGSPGTPASGGLEQPARLPLRRAITEALGTQPAHQVVQFVFTGDCPVINYISQHAAAAGRIPAWSAARPCRQAAMPSPPGRTPPFPVAGSSL